MRNLPFLMQRMESELKGHRERLGEPTYCLLKTGVNSYSYRQMDLPEEFEEYLNEEGKIIINGDEETCGRGLEGLQKIINYYRNKKK